MEISVYYNLNCLNNRRPVYSSRVSCVEGFDFTSAINVFKSIYGSSCVVVFQVYE